MKKPHTTFTGSHSASEHACMGLRHDYKDHHGMVEGNDHEKGGPSFKEHLAHVSLHGSHAASYHEEHEKHGFHHGHAQEVHGMHKKHHGMGGMGGDAGGDMPVSMPTDTSSP